MNGCTVCGATATVIRPVDIPNHDGLPLCSFHAFVCREHLKDPCGICDTT